MAFGDTYPSRSGVPTSQVVGYMPNPNDWGTDWTNREMQQQAKGPGVSFGQLLAQQVNDYAKATGVGGSYDPATGTASSPAIQSAYDFARTAFNNPSGSFLTGNAPGTAIPGNSGSNSDAATAMFGSDFYPTLNSWSWKQAPSTIRREQRALLDEKNSMVPMLSAQHLAQTAYNDMLGNGQINGVMSADYSSPDFGRITGDFGQSQLGTTGFANVNAAPSGSAPSTIWGAAPQRVRQWGI